MQKEKLLEKENYTSADEIIENPENNSATRGYDDKQKSII